jgi:cell fate regulator YaaT (PSP1 superfamily)
MSLHYLVRVGTMGQIGRFRAADATSYRRNSRVVLRTDRGLEIGDVLSEHDDLIGGSGDVLGGREEARAAAVADGTILRPMSIEDRLLEARLEQRREEAYEACAAEVAGRGLSVTLMDVEHLFDGKTLVFYFLGDVTAEVEELTGHLAETYESRAQFRQFTETLIAGCGPGCGTESATGGGCGSCSTGCAVASACSARAH